MQTAAYIRISSDSQDVSRQRQSIERWAEANTPIALWFEDATGRNSRDMAAKRQGFQRMLKAVEAGVVDCIVVDSQDRFGTKDAFEWGKFISILREHACKLLDAGGRELSADDDGAVLSGTIGALTSSREQKEKAQRNVSGKIPKAKLGEYQGGYPPYGFDVACFRDNREKWRTVYVGHFDRWKVYPDGSRERFKGKDNTPSKDASDKLFLRPTIERARLDVVRQIFKWYASELISSRQIAARLTAAKVNSIYGRPWDKVRVQQMLENPAYIGLPTWNKRGGARFVEYVGGQTRAVKNGRPGRKRDKSDFVQPDQPLYKPVIDATTWAKVQDKLKSAQTGPKSAPRTGELWLKPFLVCGQCGKPMRATRGAYYCGTYGAFGKDNPTGCRCHRVRHDRLVEIVLDYVKQTAPKLADLLTATKTGNLELARPLIEQLNLARFGLNEVWFDMLMYVDEHGSQPEAPLDVAYGLAYERLRPQLEAKIEQREQELDRMLEDFRLLSPQLRERANEKMEALDAEIKQLRAGILDLRLPWQNLTADIAARSEALARATRALGNGSAGRAKTDALTAVVAKIVCHFSPDGRRSILDRVEIYAVSGDSTSLTFGSAPRRDPVSESLKWVWLSA